MTNKIDPSVTPYRPLNGAGDSSKTREGDKAGLANPSQTAPAGSDTIEVTDSARQMASLESVIANASVVDQGRVDAIRSQIASGSYTIAPQQVADGLLRMDQAIPAGS